MKKLLKIYLRGALLLTLIFVVSTDKANAQKSKSNKQTPVVLIHGIGGADLDYQPTGKGIWSNGFPNDVLIGRAGDPQNLQFDVNGEPRPDTISKDVKAVGFYDVPGGKNITDLSKFLQKNGYVKNSELYEFAYDFRFSAVYNAAKLEEAINEIRVKNNNQPVDIVAHSFGGLIAKQYLLNRSNAANVRHLIFVGTPHLGAPKALKALRYGDNLDVKIIDGCKLKRVVHNLPGMFNLLPGRRYFAASGGGYYEDAGDIDGDNVRGVLDFDQTTFNLINGKETRCLLKPSVDALPFDKLSRILIEEHTVKFHDSLDSWTKPENVRVSMIVGYNVSTLKMLSENTDGIKLTYTTAGDGTVPLWSAETSAADVIYYADLKKLKTEHSGMIGTPIVVGKILDLLKGIEKSNPNTFSTARPAETNFLETSEIKR
jgi:pimeloyl-ACP methyl ester carboxylesterase